MMHERQVNEMSVGQRIKQKREELGMSQEELATKLGYKSRSSINKIELDIQNLTQSKIKAIAEALHTTTNFIMGWDEEIEEQEKDLCDLFSLCHGKDAYQMVQQFLRLDQADRLVIYGRILGMLDTEKYAKEKDHLSLNA